MWPRVNGDREKSRKRENLSRPEGREGPGT